jgi:RNA polymerase sigma-70 factor (ECF subfamily)
MATTIQQANLTALTSFLPAGKRASQYRDCYKQNRHRVYAISFWMTDNELAAEDLMHSTFCRVFATNAQASPEFVDRILVAELREQGPLGPLTLNEPLCQESLNVRSNTLRTHLERAIVQVPRTERMIFLLHDVEGYDHSRIARTLGLTEKESQYGLHQARLRVRSLVSAMPR